MPFFSELIFGKSSSHEKISKANPETPTDLPFQKVSYSMPISQKMDTIKDRIEVLKPRAKAHTKRHLQLNILYRVLQITETTLQALVLTGVVLTITGPTSPVGIAITATCGTLSFIIGMSKIVLKIDDLRTKHLITSNQLNNLILTSETMLMKTYLTSEDLDDILTKIDVSLQLISDHEIALKIKEKK